MELDMVPLVRERKWMDDVMRCHLQLNPENLILDWFKSVLLFAIQHAELRSQALRQCWSTRQWDIVRRPSWSYGDVTPSRINIQQFTSKFLSTPLLPPEIQDEIFSKLPFMTRRESEWSHCASKMKKSNAPACMSSPGQATNASHLKLVLQIR